MDICWVSPLVPDIDTQQFAVVALAFREGTTMTRYGNSAKKKKEKT